MNCANCQFEFEGNYCPNCGQKAISEKLKSKDIFIVAGNAIVAFEKRYWQTIKDFYRNPRKLVENYSQGKRKHYSSPLLFFYFFATLSFIIFQIFSDDPDLSLVELSVTTNGDTDSEKIDKSLAWSAENIQFLITHYRNILQLALPIIFGFVFRIFYYKRYNLAESFVFSFYFLTFAIEIPSLLTIPLKTIGLERISIYIFLLFHIIYAFSFMGKSKIGSVFIGLLSIFITFALFVVSLFTILVLMHLIVS